MTGRNGTGALPRCQGQSEAGTRPERPPGAGDGGGPSRGRSSSPAGLKLALRLQVYRTTDAQDGKVPLETLPKSKSMLLP